MAIVQLEDVKKIYTLGKTEVHALRGVTFAIEKVILLLLQALRARASQLSST